LPLKWIKVFQLLEKERLDKWLWTVRVFKTRAMATEACRKGRILVNGMEAKPSREIKPGESVTVRKPPLVYSYIVKNLTNSRLPAKLVPEFLDDQTSPEELEKLKVRDSFFYTRDRGTGRPTKKERREIDKLRNH
jgi:ribosome-associated heat shock protein Hsp15